MKWFFLLAILLSGPVLHCQKKNVPSTTNVYSEDGQLQLRIQYDPGCSCKTYSEFYHDGKLLAKKTFRVTEQKEYVDGEEISYYRDGTIKSFKIWKNAFPDGRAYQNHENGKLAAEQFYAGRFKTGTWRYFDRNGQLIRELSYEPGKTLWNAKADNVTVKYYANNKLSYKEVLIAGKKQKSEVLDSSGYRLVKSVAKKTVHLKQDNISGKTLFESKCALCHSAAKPGYGPALAGVTSRHTADWLRRWIRNGMQLVAQEDKDAMTLYSKWNMKSHPVFEQLSEFQVQSLIDYLKAL